jgi:P27 family predicted phage terminase small subunit
MENPPTDRGKILTMPFGSTLPPAEMPTWLKGEARKCWRRHEAELTRAGNLNVLFGFSFALLCSCWADYLEIEEQIRKDGMVVTGAGGRPVAHPLTAARSQALRQYLSLAREFGMTPATRRRSNQ